ncbi:MAG: GFA family protein [Myxococcales bacterium]|nr:GFA family protein [Myxococcales bacterium]
MTDATDSSSTEAPTQASTHEGGCACGVVRYRMQSAPMVVHCCHCSFCQRETGSAFAVNALIERDRVKLLSGDVKLVDTPSNSGKGQRIARCSACQTALYSHYAYGNIGDSLCFVRVGTLDDPSQMPPDVHIFTDSRQPWVQLPVGAPSYAQFYKASDVWSEGSLQRRAALFATAASRAS